MSKRTIASLAKREAELVAELSRLRAEIAARAGEAETTTVDHSDVQTRRRTKPKA